MVRNSQARTFKLVYTTKHGQSKKTSATTLRAAIRASIIRIALREYDACMVYHEEMPVAFIKERAGNPSVAIADRSLL